MANSDLYRWERLTKPRVYSRSQNLTTGEDVQNWIKTVEDASGRAAAEAFGTKFVPSHALARNKRSVIQDARIHEAAFSEAQDLLEQWANEKLTFDSTDAELFDEPLSSGRGKSRTEIKSEWDHLIDTDTTGYLTERQENRSKQNGTAKADPYQLLNEDDSSAVNRVLRGMLEKELIKDDFVKDLGLGNGFKTAVDPRVKMALRHAQVKENREKRAAEKEQRRRELEMRKDAHVQVRNVIQKEEREKEIKAKQEEALIQREMIRVRKEMEDERQKNIKDRIRRRQEEEDMERFARDQFTKHSSVEQEARSVLQHQTEERRRKILQRIEQSQKREAIEGLKVKRKYFSAWYDVVLERRMQLGKAKATADWKCVFRAFAAWKSLAMGQRVALEADQHALHIKEAHRKEVLAYGHWRRHAQRRAFTAWQVYVVGERNDRLLQQVQSETKYKMATFLEAASSGRLWTDQSAGAVQAHSSVLPSPSTNSARDRVDDRFANNLKVNQGSQSTRTMTSSSACGELRLNMNEGSGPLKIIAVPREAWQVTHKHLKLTANQLMAARGDSRQATMPINEIRDTRLHDTASDNTNISNPDQSSRIESGTRNQFAVKPPAVHHVDRFEHRHQAQQKILETQQQQLKEQQRLIEQLQYLQRQQLLLAQQNITGAPGAAAEVGVHIKNETGLQKHLNRVQSEVLGKQTQQLEDGKSHTGGFTNRNASAPSTGRTDISASDASSGVLKTSARLPDDPRHIQFAQAMENRAMERQRLRKEREEKKRQIENEKLLQLQKEEEEKKQKEEEEKRRRAREFKEKKELEKQRELQQQQDVERMKELMSLAVAHHMRAILKYRGFLPWKKLVQLVKANGESANLYSKNKLLRRTITAWSTTVKAEIERKQKMADEMNNYQIVRRCFRSWKQCKNYQSIELQKAIRFHESNLLSKVFHGWMDYTTEEKVSSWHKERLAKDHSIVRLQRTALRAWQRFPSLIREDREREKRREEMRKKVASLIPDFEAILVTPSQSVDKSAAH